MWGEKDRKCFLEESEVISVFMNKKFIRKRRVGLEFPE